ncbi:hypothetical protein ACH0B6_19080 [Solibacillus silvestris]
MSTKRIELQLDGPASSTVLQLENDTDQGVFHVTLRDLDSTFNDVAVVGVILDTEQLEEIAHSISEILAHQNRTKKNILEFPNTFISKK